MVKESSSRRKSLLLNRGTVLPVGLAEWKHQQCRCVVFVGCCELCGGEDVSNGNHYNLLAL
eukprot:873459-Pelagomonas_calceolata.AAC.3